MFKYNKTKEKGFSHIAKERGFSHKLSGIICYLLIFCMLFVYVPTSSATALYSFGTINTSGVNIRHTVGGLSFDQLKRGTVVQIIETSKDKTNETWYGVYIGAANIGGYILAKYIDLMPAHLASSYAINNPTAVRPGAGPISSINAGGYVKTTAGGTNLRVSPDGFVISKVERNVVFPYVSVETRSDYTWYRVFSAEKGYGYLRSDCVIPTNNSGKAIGGSPSNNPLQAQSVYGSITLTLDKVNLRISMDSNSMRVGHLALGSVLPLLSEPVEAGGYIWYHVETNIGKGYVRGDCARLTSAPVLPVHPILPDSTTQPLISQYGTVTMTLDNVNIRKTPAVDGIRLGKVLFGQSFQVLAPPENSGGYAWYNIKSFENITGYVRGDCLRFDTPIQTLPNQPVATPAPLSYGSLSVVLPAVNFRQSPEGPVIGRVDIGQTYQVISAPITLGAYIWYPITLNGVNGYLRSDCVIYSPAVNPGINPGATVAPILPPAVQGNSSYLITTVDKTNLRKSTTRTSTSVFNVPLGTVMEFSRDTFVGSTQWYKIKYNGYDLWVLGSCVRIMTKAEYQAWAVSQPAPTPQLAVGFVTTTMQKVNLRIKPAGDVVTSIVNSGTTLPYFAAESTRSYTWYKVIYNNITAFVRSDCVKLSTETGADLPLPTIPGIMQGGKLQAEYKTLMTGDSNDAVKALQAELKKQNFYSGEINGNYTSLVEQAVRAFQTAKGLVVDGIAGPITQHTLFNTIPIGPNTGTGGNTGFEMHYPVKKIDWWTGGIQQLWAKGANAQLKDVKTGIVFWVHRWSGGSHVDGEPLTTEDTARVCQMYGVKNQSEIIKQNLWQRRPLWITLAGNTYCCSLYGVPHNVAGDTIKNNDFEGQFCIHFTNSKTHTNNQVDKYHEEAIEFAFKTGQSTATDTTIK